MSLYNFSQEESELLSNYSDIELIEFANKLNNLIIRNFSEEVDEDTQQWLDDLQKPLNPLSKKNYKRIVRTYNHPSTAAIVPGILGALGGAGLSKVLGGKARRGAIIGGTLGALAGYIPAKIGRQALRRNPYAADHMIPVDDPKTPMDFFIPRDKQSEFLKDLRNRGAQEVIYGEKKNK